MQMRLHWWVFLHCLCLQPYIVLLRLFSCEGSYLSGKEVSAAGSSIIEHTNFSGTWRGLIRKLFYECSLKNPGVSLSPLRARNRIAIKELNICTVRVRAHGFPACCVPGMKKGGNLMKRMTLFSTRFSFLCLTHPPHERLKKMNFPVLPNYNYPCPHIRAVLPLP